MDEMDSVDRVAERRLNAAWIFQSSLRDEGTYGLPNRGLKATATIAGSLRDPDWQPERMWVKASL